MRATSGLLRGLSILFCLFVSLLTTEALADAKDLLRHVPNDASGVVVANFDGLRKSSSWKLLTRMARSEFKRDLRKLRSDFGLDPFRDIRRAAVVFAKDFDHHDEKMLLILDGRIKRAKVDSFVKRTMPKRFLKIQKRRGETRYQLGRGGKWMLAFRGRYALLGETGMVRRVLAKRRVGYTKFSARELGRDLIVRFDFGAKMQKELGQEIKPASKLLTVQADSSARQGLVLSVRGWFQRAQAAKAMVKELRSLSQKARKELAGTGLESYFARIAVNHVGRQVRLRLVLTSLDIKNINEKITKAMKSKRRRRHRR